jgi:ribonuclease P protein component
MEYAALLKPDVLRDQRDFNKLYSKGKSVHSRYLVLIYIRNGFSFNRYAFLASKKVGNSVKRNRARRLMKESFRAYREEVKQGFDILFIARNTIDGVKCAEVWQSMKNTLTKSDLLK